MLQEIMDKAQTIGHVAGLSLPDTRKRIHASGHSGRTHVTGHRLQEAAGLEHASYHLGALFCQQSLKH